MSSTVAERYAALAETGEIAFDAAQAEVAGHLTRLSTELVNRRMAEKKSNLGWLFARRQKEAPLKGIYIWGAVGRGKTMLIDLFYETSGLKRKRRTHYNDFMADVHDRVQRWRKKMKAGEAKSDDPIHPVAREIARETRLLCLDEFHVDDIADAMILDRLFTRLFDRGVVLVTTSNVAPDDLYANGLNRGLFLPFIALLKQQVEVLCLDANSDYRLGRLRSSELYFSPADGAARNAMDQTWKRLTGDAHGRPADIEVKGRHVRVPESHDGVARFSFADLCEAPLGTNDYLKIAATFHTVFVDGVPQLKPEQRNEARRFVLLIDTLYDHKVKLVVSADAEPDSLYTAGDSAAEFQRTASRLYEMRSEDYLTTAYAARETGADIDLPS